MLQGELIICNFILNLLKKFPEFSLVIVLFRCHYVTLLTGFCARTGCVEVIVEANDKDIVDILLQPVKMIEKPSHDTPNVLVRLQDKVISITELVNRLPPSLSVDSTVDSVSFLHCFTGCGTVSFIFSKGKKTILRAAVPWLPQISVLTNRFWNKLTE